MSGARQYVAVQSNPWDRRDYTYHNDGEPVAIGDKVLVITDRGESVVTVMSLPNFTPSFSTKPIAGRAPADTSAEPARIAEL